MTLTLATAWHPRGEYTRFERLLPQLQQAYQAIIIALPPGTDPAFVQQLAAMGNGEPPVVPVVAPEWSSGRHLALRTAYGMQAEFVHYVDFDRLLRWVETRPEEWLEAAAAVQAADCLVIGRTAAAYATHPQALVQTEAISNCVASHFLGREMDVSAGSKGFSRRVLEVIVAQGDPGRPFGTDAEWPLLAQKAGYTVHYMQAAGLDWESADRYQDQAATAAGQRQAAADYDAAPHNWDYRTRVALEIVAAALRTAQPSHPEAASPLPSPTDGRENGPGDG